MYNIFIYGTPNLLGQPKRSLDQSTPAPAAIVCRCPVQCGRPRTPPR